MARRSLTKITSKAGSTHPPITFSSNTPHDAVSGGGIADRTMAAIEIVMPNAAAVR